MTSQDSTATARGSPLSYKSSPADKDFPCWEFLFSLYLEVRSFVSGMHCIPRVNFVCSVLRHPCVLGSSLVDVSRALFPRCVTICAVYMYAWANRKDMRLCCLHYPTNLLLPTRTFACWESSILPILRGPPLCLRYAWYHAEGLCAVTSFFSLSFC